MKTKFAAVLAFALFAASAAHAQMRMGGLNPVRRTGLRNSPAPAAPAAQNAPAAGTMTSEDLKNVPRGTNGVPALAFNQAPVELVLEAYAEQIGKTVIPAPDLPKATITLKSLEGQTLTKEEYLEAIETVLTLNGVVLEERGEKFLRAFARKTARTQGISMLTRHPSGELHDRTRVVSQLITFQNIIATEAQKALEGFKDPSGLFQVFERINAILVTDTQENINRMLEIAKILDVATPVTEDVFVRQVKFAVANDIKTALETIVTESQKETTGATSGPKTSGTPGFGRANAPVPPPRLLNPNGRPGLLQPPPQPAATANETLLASVSDADRGMIRGKVLILADERSNKLIIITSKANMNFFDKVIETLDVETTPEVSVEVIRLKYADAEEVASMLNDLIGAGSSSSSQQKNAPANTSRSSAGNQNLTQNRTAAQQPRQPRTGAGNTPTFSGSGNLGELNKDNIKVLADKRINGIVVMARRADMKAVKDVIEDMDVKLSQVLIETVIIQVELGDDLSTGIDWVQRGRYKQATQVQQTDSYGRKLFYAENANGTILDTLVPEGYSGTTANGTAISASTVPAMKTVFDTVRDGFFNNGGANSGYMLGGGAGSGTSLLGGLMNAATAAATNETTLTAINPIGGGLNYLLKSDKLNIAAVIQASKGDSRTKVLASPILMTVDNKEATIEATDMIYLFSGYQYSGSSMYGSQVKNYEKRDIGLTVKVTPRINPNGTVVLTVEQTFETQGADQNVPNESGGTDPYATVTTRKISSDVSVENRQTVVMGGLTKKTNVESENGIPILKDIPYIGKWLFGSVSMKEARSELLVFMTPYVLDDAAVAQAEALRRKKALSDPRPWDDNGWSASPLADPVSKKEVLRRFKDEWKAQDEERSTKLAIEKAKLERAKKLKKMSEDEREFWIKLHEKELKEELDEKKKESEEEQKDLRELVESIKKDKLSDADKEIDKAGQAVPNEYRKFIDEVKKGEAPMPSGDLLHRDVEKAEASAPAAGTEAQPPAPAAP